jgi:hypothetical protein
MYQLSFSGSAHSFRTMLEVLRFLRDDASVAAVDAAKIALTFFSHPVSVTRYNGTLTVRRPGTATSLFLSLIDEIDAAYFRPSFTALEAWQIRREHWQLLYLAFDLAREPLYLFSSDQIAQANEEAAAKSGRRGLDLFELLQDESQRRFGFRYAGPVLDNRQSNGRHEVHVAYALAAGKPVPQAVIDDYASLSKFDSDLQWAKPLLAVPELRGALPLAKLVPLATVMRHSKQAITSDNAALLAMLMGLVPNSPTTVEVDDLLYAKGILEAHPLPAAYLKPVDIGLPTCQFRSTSLLRLSRKRKSTFTSVSTSGCSQKSSARFRRYSNGARANLSA